eukprot:680781-Pelagomonas_calceolata.AAC.1
MPRQLHGVQQCVLKGASTSVRKQPMSKPTGRSAPSSSSWTCTCDNVPQHVHMAGSIGKGERVNEPQLQRPQQLQLDLYKDCMTGYNSM